MEKESVYTDIHLKEKDYHADKNLEFFLIQEQKALKMLEEVKNFHTSFMLSKTVSFNHILSIIDRVKWIDVTGGFRESRWYSKLKLNMYIPCIAELSEDHFIKLTTEQQLAMKGNKNKSIDEVLGWKVASKIYDVAKRRRYEINDEFDDLARKIREEFKIQTYVDKLCHEADPAMDKDAYYAKVNGVKKLLNENYKERINSLVLKYRKFLVLENAKKKFILVDNNTPVCLPNQKDIKVSITSDQTECLITSDYYSSVDNWNHAPTWLGKRVITNEDFTVWYNIKTNEYARHTHTYSRETEEIRR